MIGSEAHDHFVLLPSTRLQDVLVRALRRHVLVRRPRHILDLLGLPREPATFAATRGDTYVVLLLHNVEIVFFVIADVSDKVLSCNQHVVGVKLYQRAVGFEPL